MKNILPFQSNCGAKQRTAPALITANAEARVGNLRAACFAESSHFSGLKDKPGFKADNWKAFIEFDICHALPTAWLGPVSNGDYIGFFGDTLAQSYESLLFQQMNYRHQLKLYAPEGKKAGKKDCIIGSIVAVAMPSKPMEGWYSPANPKGSKNAVIHALAVAWKMADGMDEIIGEHLTGREEQSVSIEVITDGSNLGIWRPSTNEIYKFADVPEAWADALHTREDSSIPRIGKLGDEQLVVVYGAGGKPVEFRGVGMTPNPAEKHFGTQIPKARITSVNAEEMIACAAESLPQTMCGTRMRFESGAIGTIQKVRTQGLCAGHRASEEDPLVGLQIGDRGWVELPLSAVRRRLRQV